MHDTFEPWRKSTRSSGGDNCVEVSFSPDGVVGVRDSKDQEGAILTFSHQAWRAFIDAVHDEEFDC